MAHLGGELSSAVQPAELAAPGGPELEAVAQHTVDGKPPFQVTQPLGHMIGSCTLRHAGGVHLHIPVTLVSTRPCIKSKSDGHCTVGSSRLKLGSSNRLMCCVP